MALPVRYATRNAWGADTSIPRHGYAANPASRTECYVHHTVAVDPDATPNVFENDAECYYWMQRLQKIRPDLGLDVPYNFVAFFRSDQTVLICEGRGAQLTGAHTYGHNTSAIAIALNGNFNLPTFGLEKFLPSLGVFFFSLRGGLVPAQGPALPNLGNNSPAGSRDVFGHRDSGAQTACPGNNAYNSLGVVQLVPAAAPEPPKEWDEMVTKAELTKIVEDVVRNETDSKRAVYKFRDHTGKTWGHIFKLDSENGRMVHEINPRAYLDTGSAYTDAITLDAKNKDDAELLRLPVLFPKGITNLAEYAKPR